MKNISARVIAKSLNSLTGDILTTFVLEYPRMIHPEVLTHRLFSRNTSSSRAVPVKKMLKRLEEKYFIPEFWGRNQKGMSAEEEIGMNDRLAAHYAWDRAKLWATRQSFALLNIDIHKQIANRLTEPFQIIQCIISATDLENFFYLRDSKFAQPEVCELAKKMKAAYENTPAQILQPFDWHLPFISEEELDLDLHQKIAISVARCARVSYFLQDGNKSDWGKDLALAKRLIENKHLSPTEHVAAATPQRVRIANYVGWMQYRKYLDEECQDDMDVPIFNNIQAREMMVSQ